MFRIQALFAVPALAAGLLYAAPSPAQTIVDEWSSVKAPPAPELKQVTLDSKTTAILVMDFVKQTCNSDRRPRCVASIPKIEKLITAARAQGVMLIFTTVPPVPIADTLPAIAPKTNDPVVVAFVDKFTLGDKDTGLEKMLKCWLSANSGPRIALLGRYLMTQSSIFELDIESNILVLIGLP